MFENVVGEFIHTCRCRRACRTHHLVTHRIHRADVVNKLALQVNRELLPVGNHLRHALVGGISTGIHRARQQQCIAGLPSQCFRLGHSIEVNPPY